MNQLHRESLARVWAPALTGLAAFSVVGLLMASAAASAGAGEQQTIVHADVQTSGADFAMAAPSAPVTRPIPEGSLIQPKELAGALAGPAEQRPVVLQVGFRVLYRSGHIAGSRYIGPASKPEGLQALRDAVRKLPRSKPLVLYCGCCPWADCPNMRAAYAAMGSAGRTVRILYIAKNLQTNWIDAGLPTASGEP